MSDVPDLSSDDDNYEEDDWKEMEVSRNEVKCLFCLETFFDVETAIKHSETVHNFNFKLIKYKFSIDSYSYIKMINYIKTCKPEPLDIINSDKVLWNDDKYLKPVDNDEWLMYDIDSLTEERQSEPKTFHANIENGIVTLSQSHFIELQSTIQKLNDELKESQSCLEMAKVDMAKMRLSMKMLVENSNSENGIVVNSVSKVAVEDDQGYFHSYAHFGIHYDMLSDKVRTETYRDAIITNSSVIKDKTVLDLGCGTGILSMFSATAGAKTVFAIDQSDIVFHAMDIIRENNLHDVIKVIKGRLENTKLDEQVDIIVSEWMGYFLLFEGMLDSVIYARENCLKPNGVILPSRCNISLTANADVDTHKKLIEYWSDVYGYKMNCMKSEVIREASIDVIDSKHIISTPCVIQEIDMYKCNIDAMDFHAQFSLPILRDGFVTSIVGYFDTFFDLPNSLSFSTGPHVTPTHWKQTVFYLKDCKKVAKGDILEGTITCERQKSDVRALTVIINLFGKSHKYIMS